MTETNNPGLIYQKIPLIMKEVTAVEKKSRNTTQNYQFRGIDDVMAAFHAPLVRHGVFYVPEVLHTEVTERQSAKGNALIYTTLTVAYTFFAEDGSAVRAVCVGEAMDSGDKSSNKAMSAALKYALLQIFCVPTEAQEDADYESHEVAPIDDHARLDVAILASLKTLNKSEADFNKWVQGEYQTDSEWKDQSLAVKRELLDQLKRWLSSPVRRAS